jgi:hypothetical protein
VSTSSTLTATTRYDTRTGTLLDAWLDAWPDESAGDRAGREDLDAHAAPGRTEPWFAALDLTADDTAPARARRWVDACLAVAGVAPGDRSAIRRVGTELAREASLRAQPGETVRVELDLVGPIARMSARGPAQTQRLGTRAVEALHAAYEWGIERVQGGSRLVWCHLELA